MTNSKKLLCLLLILMFMLSLCACSSPQESNNDKSTPNSETKIEDTSNNESAGSNSESADENSAVEEVAIAGLKNIFYSNFSDYSPDFIVTDDKIVMSASIEGARSDFVLGMTISDEFISAFETLRESTLTFTTSAKSTLIAADSPKDVVMYVRLSDGTTVFRFKNSTIEYDIAKDLDL